MGDSSPWTSPAWLQSHAEQSHQNCCNMTPPPMGKQSLRNCCGSCHSSTSCSPLRLGCSSLEARALSLSLEAGALSPFGSSTGSQLSLASTCSGMSTSLMGCEWISACPVDLMGWSTSLMRKAWETWACLAWSNKGKSKTEPYAVYYEDATDSWDLDLIFVSKMWHSPH